MSKLKKAVGGKKAAVAKKKRAGPKTERAGVPDVVAPAPAAVSRATEDPGKPPSRSRRRRGSDPKRAKPAPVPQPVVEQEIVKTTRAQVAAVVAKVSAGRPKVAIDLTLAILNQETGNHAAANLLIDEFDLEELFGLKKF